MNRRQLILAAGGFALGGCASRSNSPAKRTARQFHNQPAQSHQHQFLTDLWAQVAKESGGRLEVTVYPQNNNIPGSDPGALEMLQSGELEFFTLMGGILGRKVPVAEIQGLPFASASPAQLHPACQATVLERSACRGAGHGPAQRQEIRGAAARLHR